MSTPRLLRATAVSLSTFGLMSGLWATTAGAGSPHVPSAPPAATTTTSTSTTTTVPSTTTSTTTPLPTTTTVPPPTTTTTSTGAAAESLLAKSINAANSETGVTWSETEVEGEQSIVEVGRVGAAGGTLTLSAHLGSQAWAMVIELIGTRLYVLANTPALEQIWGFKDSAAKSESGKWFYVPASQTYLYDTFSVGLTLPTATAQVNMVGALSVLPERTLLGQSVFGIHQVTPGGIVTQNETVYVRANGSPLPVEGVITVEGITLKVVYSNWGKAPVIVVPKGAVAFNKNWLLKPVPSF